MDQQTRRDHPWQAPTICLALAVMTAVVFGQTLRHQFINFDDNDYVYKNPVVVHALTLKGLAWAFSFHSSNWHPLTWVSHMLDCQLYGLNPAGHHLTSVLLHGTTVIMLFLVLRQMTGALWRSAFVAAVFAIHPLRAESVAWVAERKDVLSGLFFVLTIGAYVRFARRPRSLARYGLVVLLFALGLMSKPMLVTLPLVLLLLDYWPLRREESTTKLAIEKLPLLALSAGSCVATWFAQNAIIQVNESVSMPLRAANAVSACMIYLGQMVFPRGLAACYPYPLNGLPIWEVALDSTLLAGLFALAFWQRREQPWIWVGWIWYVVMLLPVLGIIQVGSQSHADRYTYVAQIGIYIAITWSVAEWTAKHPSSRPLLAGVTAGVLAALMICAWNQTSYWRNSETLWTHTLACTTHNEVAEFALANDLLDNGDVDGAVTHFQKAAAINPKRALIHYNLGSALYQQNRLDEAIAEFQKALQIRPDYEEAHNNLATALLQEGKLDEAISHFQSAVQLRPHSVNARVNLGIALLRKGKVDDAIACFQTALQIDSSSDAAQYNLGLALAQKGKPAGHPARNER